MEQVTVRQSDILDLARQNGRVEVDWLADRFEMTPQTIRRDLNDLCDRGMLRRVHGGATYPTSVSNYAYDSRRVLAADAKRHIGERAAMLIPDHSSIMLNIGTTTEQVAMAMVRHEGLMAVTNNINVAQILREAPSAEVMLAGGLVRPGDGGIVGEAAVSFIRQFKVDFAIIGASAIDTEGTILDFDFREVSVSKEIIAHARKTILVADYMKFERTAPVRIGSLADIDMFVTDQRPPQAIADLCHAHSVRLEITDETASEIQSAIPGQHQREPA